MSGLTRGESAGISTSAAYSRAFITRTPPGSLREMISSISARRSASSESSTLTLCRRL